MSRPCYQKDNYIIVENANKKKNYFTVINLDNNCHSHLYTYQQAKLVIHWCIKGRIPNRYSYHMKESIKRLRPDLDFDKDYNEINFEYDNIKLDKDYSGTIFDSVV